MKTSSLDLALLRISLGEPPVAQLVNPKVPAARDCAWYAETPEALATAVAASLWTPFPGYVHNLEHLNEIRYELVEKSTIEWAGIEVPFIEVVEEARERGFKCPIEDGILFVGGEDAPLHYMHPFFGWSPERMAEWYYKGSWLEDPTEGLRVVVRDFEGDVVDEFVFEEDDGVDHLIDWFSGSQCF